MKNLFRMLMGPLHRHQCFSNYPIGQLGDFLLLPYPRQMLSLFILKPITSNHRQIRPPSYKALYISCQNLIIIECSHNKLFANTIGSFCKCKTRYQFSKSRYMSSYFLADEVLKQLQDSGATYIYTSQELLNKAKEAADKYGKIKVINWWYDSNLQGLVSKDVYDFSRLFLILFLNERWFCQNIPFHGFFFGGGRLALKAH